MGPMVPMGMGMGMGMGWPASRCFSITADLAGFSLPYATGILQIPVLTAWKFGTARRKWGSFVQETPAGQALGDGPKSRTGHFAVPRDRPSLPRQPLVPWAMVHDPWSMDVKRSLTGLGMPYSNGSSYSSSVGLSETEFSIWQEIF